MIEELLQRIAELEFELEEHGENTYRQHRPKKAKDKVQAPDLDWWEAHAAK